jgi:glutathione peroxidase-family protein
MTRPSYTRLAEFRKQYPGLEIVLFPSYEFGGQELPENEIAAFVSGYGLPTDGDGCTLMSPVKVNPGGDPVWAYIRSVFPGNVAWNFGCWALFDAQGNPVGRFGGRELDQLSDKVSALV